MTRPSGYWARRASTPVAALALLCSTAVGLAQIPPPRPAGEIVLAIAPASLSAIDRVDERFQSYNVESVEVTGGNFWAPYPKPGEAPRQAAAGPHGTEFASGAYQKREPLDLKGNRRLRMLTKALGPAYMRVSGSWANNIWFQDDDQPERAPPPGYQGVLTRAQWAGVVDFGRAVDAKILTSFATNEAARDANGYWKPDQARRLFAYTKALGGRIDAVELSNEPNVRRPAYAPDVFARDQAALRKLVEEVSPGTLLVARDRRARRASSSSRRPHRPRRARPDC
jgi:heparanase